SQDKLHVSGFWQRFRLRPFSEMVAEAGREWMTDNAPRLGAALAFYSILSAAPLLVISISLLEPFIGEAGARKEIAAQAGHWLGEAGGAAVTEILSNVQRSRSGWWAGLLGLAMLLFGASGVFGELQGSLNTIWNVPPETQPTASAMIRERFLSFLLVLG